MYCRNCGTPLDDRAVACIKCGINPHQGNTYCRGCGKPTLPNAAVCMQCGVALGGTSGYRSEKKLAAGLCGILLGSLGIHKFVLGYTTAGIIMLLVTILTCGFGAMVTHVIGLIEGILYLTKSDEEFDRTYVQNEKPWF